MSQKCIFAECKCSHEKWCRESTFLPLYPLNERKLSCPKRQCFEGTFWLCVTKPASKHIHLGKGWGGGVRFFLFVARTHPLGLKLWHPIRTVIKIWVITMQTSVMVMVVCSDGVFGCLVHLVSWCLFVCLGFFFFLFNVKLKRTNLLVQGGRETGPSIGFKKAHI